MLLVRRSSRAVAPMINRLAPIADAEAVDQRGRLLIAGYAVKRLSASLSPRDRRESGRGVPRGAHRARSALSASTRERTALARAARETPGVLGRNGEAPSDRPLGASVYRPSPLVGDERKMAPHSAPLANPFAGLSAGRVRSARTVPKMRTLANPAGCGRRLGTLSVIRTVPSRVARGAACAPRSLGPSRRPARYRSSGDRQARNRRRASTSPRRARASLC
jgi:hypothetical protein